LSQPVWFHNIPWGLVFRAAEKHKINPDMIAAVIMTESSADSQAFRFEKKWKYFYKVKENAAYLGIPEDHEKYYQSASFGLMQVMGSVAREEGFKSHLPDLFISSIGLEYGCRKLAKCLRKYPDWSDAVAAYNAGSVRKVRVGDTDSFEYVNQNHVDRFEKYLHDLKGHTHEI